MMGGMGMGVNPMQFMTGMPNSMGMNMGGMNSMGMGGIGGMGGYGGPGQFNTNMNPMMGGSYGMGAPQSNYATSMPAGSMGGFGGGASMGGQNFAAGPGPSQDSFRRDGFNILGKEPVKKVDEEGSKEFADLFSIADSKIKDRGDTRVKASYEYNPAEASSSYPKQQVSDLGNTLGSMNLGGQQPV